MKEILDENERYIKIPPTHYFIPVYTQIYVHHVNSLFLLRTAQCLRFRMLYHLRKTVFSKPLIDFLESK